jgi:hypothetical protein
VVRSSARHCAPSPKLGRAKCLCGLSSIQPLSCPRLDALSHQGAIGCVMLHASRRDVDELESLGPRPYSGRGCVSEAHVALVARAAYAWQTSDLHKPASARLSYSGTEHVRRALS